MTTFSELPFNSRPDLTPYLLHMTKNTKSIGGQSAFKNLINILKSGKIIGSGNRGFIKGPNKATCFMDVPFSSLKYVLTPENSDPEKPRYEPYGIVLTKATSYKKGCRPVLYLSDDEKRSLKIPDDELWRVVRFEVKNEHWISWVHEREWRSKGDLKLPSEILAVLVKTTKEASKLHRIMQNYPNKFKSKPRSIIPLNLICQGLIS
ncbi:hypothetical protein HKD21_12520 [Gluconobacter cerevisiae]|uniref:DUF2971 domain-containing protein n=1 Tax=Gluconobacter cerevisiae TaxID=1379734 RepID=A0ABR9YG67_9PROT|nr:hypothetical protein [Gluconobacter cerevisiae]MBF0877662.1 hypothetical protein [Gluconobacter cerevisiae]